MGKKGMRLSRIGQNIHGKKTMLEAEKCDILIIANALADNHAQKYVIFLVSREHVAINLYFCSLKTAKGSCFFV